MIADKIKACVPEGPLTCVFNGWLNIARPRGALTMPTINMDPERVASELAEFLDDLDF